MLRLIFALVMSVHGIIHLLGFVKAWNLAPVEQLSGKTRVPLSEGLTKGVGVLWLAAFVCFSTAVVLFLLQKDWWWVVGSCAVLLSQILVILYWKDRLGRHDRKPHHPAGPCGVSRRLELHNRCPE